MLTGVTAAHPQLGNMASIVEQQPVSASEPVADEEQRASAQRPSASKFLPIAQTVFIEYASIGGRTPVQLEDHALDGAKFLKICRESKLMDNKLDAPKVDVIFMRVSNGCKRITFLQFVEGLVAVAKVKGMTLEQVFIKMVNANPKAGVTKPEFVRHHDDKSTFTGMYKL